MLLQALESRNEAKRLADKIGRLEELHFKNKFAVKADVNSEQIF